jgi:hypothetical protein
LTSPRLNIHFIWFTFIFAFSQYKAHRNCLGLSKLSKQILMLSILSVFLVIASSELLNASVSNRKMQTRVSLYKRSKNKAVKLKANDIIGPPVSRYFEDIESDSTSWPNRAVTDYFELRSITKEAYK